MSNYHYTKAVHLPSIINEGKIRTTLLTGAKKEKPAVWLTTSEEWEPCCSSGKIDPLTNSSKTMSLDEMKEIMGVCRIKISEKLPTVTWAKFKHIGGISEELHNELTDFSNNKGGKTNLWNCSLKPITKEYFDSIEMLMGENWVTWDGSVSIEKFVHICHDCNSDKELPKTISCIPGFLGQMDFFAKNEEELIEIWESEKKHKRGYLIMYVDENYESCDYYYNDKNFNASEFYNLTKNGKSNCMYLHMFWKESKTQYKIAIPYDRSTKKIANDGQLSETGFLNREFPNFKQTA
jgi:hypothetical protein